MKEKFTQIPSTIIIDNNLDLYEFRILSYLISCSKNGVCFPGIIDIANKTSISKTTVKDRIGRLEAKKYIAKTTRTIGNGKKTSNLYKLNKKLIVTKEYRPEEKIDVELYDYDWLNEGEN